MNLDMNLAKIISAIESAIFLYSKCLLYGMKKNLDSNSTSATCQLYGHE